MKSLQPNAWIGCIPSLEKTLESNLTHEDFESILSRVTFRHGWVSERGTQASSTEVTMDSHDWEQIQEFLEHYFHEQKIRVIENGR